MTDAQKSLELINPDQLTFIEKELGATKEQIEAMDDDTFADLYDQLCDIEIDETPRDDSPLTERGQMAEDLVTIIGNECYSNYDPEVDDDEENDAEA